MPETEWWKIHDNIVLLTDYMAGHGSSADDVAYAVEKPWKYAEEFIEAVKESSGVTEEEVTDEG